MTANAADCAQSGTPPHTPFDPASGWDGGCDTNESIPSGKLCAGVDCVQSLTIAPVTLNETGCMPSPTPTYTPPAAHGAIFTCVLDPNATNPCADGCLVDVPGFLICIWKGGTLDCADAGAGPYTETHVGHEAVDDQQGCAPCTCDPPSGSTCSSTVSVYTDGACSTLAYSTTVDTSGPTCQDVPTGIPLGSKSATPPSYVPGTCAPDGGTLTGPLPTPSDPVTWCCLPAQ
jgi:hypothetical protein